MLFLRRWILSTKKSPIQNEYIEKYLAEKDSDLRATLDGKGAVLTLILSS